MLLIALVEQSYSQKCFSELGSLFSLHVEESKTNKEISIKEEEAGHFSCIFYLLYIIILLKDFQGFLPAL